MYTVILQGILTPTFIQKMAMTLVIILNVIDTSTGTILIDTKPDAIKVVKFAKRNGYPNAQISG